MKFASLSFLLLLLGGCQSLSRHVALADLKDAVRAAEQEAVDDSAKRSTCTQKEKRWRAPMQSQRQEIRIQRCQVVFYYLAAYSMAGGEPFAIIPHVTFLGTEDLSTGEKRLER